MAADTHHALANSSVQDGLDFAASLLCGGIQATVQSDPARGAYLADWLAQYIEYRYVSEFGLAWEKLVDLGDQCTNGGFSGERFWQQMRLTANQIGQPELDLSTRIVK